MNTKSPFFYCCLFCLTCSDLFVVFFFFSSLPMHAVPFLNTFGCYFSVCLFTERFFWRPSFPDLFLSHARDAACMQPRDARTSNYESNSFWLMGCHRAWPHSDRVRPVLTPTHHRPLDPLPR